MAVVAALRVCPGQFPIEGSPTISRGEFCQDPRRWIVAVFVTSVDRPNPVPPHSARDINIAHVSEWVGLAQCTPHKGRGILGQLVDAAALQGRAEKLEKAIEVLGADNPEAKGLVSVLKKARAQSQSQLAIGVRLDSCRAFVERAKKHLAGAEEAVTRRYLSRAPWKQNSSKGWPDCSLYERKQPHNHRRRLQTPGAARRRGFQTPCPCGGVGVCTAGGGADRAPNKYCNCSRGGESVAGHSRRVAAEEDFVDVRSRTLGRCVERWCSCWRSS